MIRDATLEDADEIDRVHVQAWQRAYADFIGPEDMIGARRPDDDRVASWRERIAGDVEVATWVYEVDGAVAGFACAGGGEFVALYVDPAAQGAGVGSALADHAEAALREEDDEASLWVFRDNEQGRRFYEARGWTLVEGSESPADWVAPGVEYRKRL